MENSVSFSQQVIQAVDNKSAWYNENFMPQLLDNYRLMHTCVENLTELLEQKSLIKPDPYKLDRKISDIKGPDNTQFIETERGVIIGARFSEYETMLDYICTYYKFSIEHMNIVEIKKFIDFNNSFCWTSFTANSNKPNTRGLAQLVSEARNGSSALTVSSIADMLSKLSKATVDITNQLKELTDFQKEVYKCHIRKDIFEHPKYDNEKASGSAQEEMAQIKKLFPSVMGKQPFYTQLVEEIVSEDHDGNKAQLQEALLKKLQVQKKQNTKKEKKIDTKELLMNAVLALSGMGTQFEAIQNKFNENHQVLQNEHNSFMEKFKAVLRKAFNMPEPQIIYKLMVTDPATQTTKKMEYDFTALMNELQKKTMFYNSFNLKKNPGYIKIENAPEEKILDFLTKQMADVQKLSSLLKAFDDHFKQAPAVENRSKIKGISMELTIIKNNLINTNQHRADYISYVEEQEQMKKLGITDDED